MAEWTFKSPGDWISGIHHNKKLVINLQECWLAEPGANGLCSKVYLQFLSKVCCLDIALRLFAYCVKIWCIPILCCFHNNATGQQSAVCLLQYMADIQDDMNPWMAMWWILETGVECCGLQVCPKVLENRKMRWWTITHEGNHPHTHIRQFKNALVHQSSPLWTSHSVS